MIVSANFGSLLSITCRAGSSVIKTNSNRRLRRAAAVPIYLRGIFKIAIFVDVEIYVAFVPQTFALPSISPPQRFFSFCLFWQSS